MMTKRLLLTLVSFLTFFASVKAQNIENYTPEYLDTVKVNRGGILNDYSMIGIQYGYTGSMVSWNPNQKQTLCFRPLNFGVTYTKYGKMFGYLPYFGFQVGLLYTQEGYKFKEDKETGITPTLEGAEEAIIQNLELPFLAHCHIDMGSRMKFLVNLGLFLGYRMKIERIGENVAEEIRYSFLDSDYRFDYGLKGGLGLAYMLDPIEFHLQFSYKQSLMSLYQADHFSQYRYRYAYPMNFIASFGVHYQLSRRYGKTHKDLKKEARDNIYNPEKNVKADKNR